MGYDAVPVSDLAGRRYSKITVEYAQSKKDQAEMVKNDLGKEGDVELKEIGGLERDVIIYNLFPKDELLDLGALDGKASVKRDLVKIKLLEGGAGKEEAEKIKTLVYQGGFTPEDEIGEAQKRDNQGLIVIYLDDAQKDNAEDLAAFLRESGYQAKTEKNAEDGNAEMLTLIAGK